MIVYLFARSQRRPAPSIAPWIADFVEEVCGFPSAAHDEQVDAMTQALQRIFLTVAITTSYLQMLAPACETCGTPTLARDGYACQKCNDEGFIACRDVSAAELYRRRGVT